MIHGAARRSQHVCCGMFRLNLATKGLRFETQQSVVAIADSQMKL